MATKGPLRPLARLLQPRPVHTLHHRTFLNSLLPSDKPLSINVTRTLPYPRAQLYALIVDVDAYSTFLPFCSHSRVTAWSAPDAEAAAGGTRWPTEGELTVGYGPITQSYTSRIVCVPGRSVEALSGNEEPAVAAKDGGKNPFKQLATKWTVEDALPPMGAGGAGKADEVPWTRVDLDMRMRLEDPFLQMMLSKVTGETAEKMIEAFEKRVRESFGQGR